MTTTTSTNKTIKAIGMLLNPEDNDDNGNNNKNVGENGRTRFEIDFEASPLGSIMS